MSNNPRKRRKEPIPGDVIRYVDHSLNIVKNINIILKKKGKNHAYLADLLGKSQSEISKWMCGTHNFTLKTISRIEEKLGESIVITTSIADHVEKLNNAIPREAVFNVNKIDANSKIMKDLPIIDGGAIIKINKNKKTEFKLIPSNLSFKAQESSSIDI